MAIVVINIPLRLLSCQPTQEECRPEFVCPSWEVIVAWVEHPPLESFLYLLDVPSSVLAAIVGVLKCVDQFWVDIDRGSVQNIDYDADVLQEIGIELGQVRFLTLLLFRILNCLEFVCHVLL